MYPIFFFFFFFLVGIVFGTCPASQPPVRMIRHAQDQESQPLTYRQVGPACTCLHVVVNPNASIQRNGVRFEGKIHTGDNFAEYPAQLVSVETSQKRGTRPGYIPSVGLTASAIQPPLSVHGGKLGWACICFLGQRPLCIDSTAHTYQVKTTPA